MSWLVSPLVLTILGGCLCAPPPPPVPVRAPAPPEPAPAADVEQRATPEDATAQECDAPVPVLEQGRQVGSACPADARRQGLTLLDLSDDWVPLLFRDPENLVQLPQPYRATYVALANEEFPSGPDGERARRDAFLELYGIFPSFRVLSARLLDEERHLCHAAVDGIAIQALEGSPRPSAAASAADVKGALAALEQRLQCERLLPPARRTPRWRLQEALEAYQRKHTIVSRGALDPETRRALAEDSRELDFRALLRSLRARVVDATGLIEDGSAAAARGAVLSRRIDGDAFFPADPYDALEAGAPDLVSPATEAAAQALGWTDPAAAAGFFRVRGLGATRRLVVAVRLPPVPAYHAEHMELRAEIDRGDVWYELPTWRGRIAHRPTLTLYARTGDGEEIALVRWPTTIGGWKKEVGPRGRVGLRYKNSDVGKRLWRFVVASPAWLPPPQTPARALVHRAQGSKRWLPETDLLGPGYASAYGLVMLPHLRPVEAADATLWYDNGIRTHGSVNYQSILGSESHGCHRLFNHAAVQLASFLLQHREHVRHGLITRPFVHEFTWRGMKLRHPIPHRGYRWELTPPVEVEVLEGTVRGKIRRVPQRLVSLSRPRPKVQAPGAAPPAVPVDAADPAVP
ncbi:L,D-transpeptidase family protein [Anaeromyxobacter terrae]|uniref:hypothetical protein n=1 Tax=Anaeromyxobacter terrae TaxID=2925406 RepID=UPI001F576DEB|nr:hypothetical protein [Anaeromyxobacter sp. SG22]